MKLQELNEKEKKAQPLTRDQLDLLADALFKHVTTKKPNSLVSGHDEDWFTLRTANQTKGTKAQWNFRWKFQPLNELAKRLGLAREFTETYTSSPMDLQKVLDHVLRSVDIKKIKARAK